MAGDAEEAADPGLWVRFNKFVHDQVSLFLLGAIVMNWAGATLTGPGKQINDVRDLLLKEVQARTAYEQVEDARFSTDEASFRTHVDSMLIYRNDTQATLRGLLVLVCDGKPPAVLDYLSMRRRCENARIGNP